MKIKNDKEIFEIATKDVLSNYEVEESRKSIPSFTAHAMIDSFMEGAKWMQSDLIESASEGFEEWWRSQNLLYPNLYSDAWQACSLYHAKTIKEKDERIKELEKELKCKMEVAEAWWNKYQEVMKDIGWMSEKMLVQFDCFFPANREMVQEIKSKYGLNKEERES